MLSQPLLTTIWCYKDNLVLQRNMGSFLALLQSAISLVKAFLLWFCWSVQIDISVFVTCVCCLLQQDYKFRYYISIIECYLMNSLTDCTCKLLNIESHVRDVFARGSLSCSSEHQNTRLKQCTTHFWPFTSHSKIKRIYQNLNIRVWATGQVRKKVPARAVKLNEQMMLPRLTESYGFLQHKLCGRGTAAEWRDS